ncbi:uncharacterized protein LOC110463616 isoform X5 [Mizuhopecten yessoensis]|uniref:uncharacterized protein LOC110463616 isoform X5 n=1 Tax=Mizuhopecten yessoensis TaxID=6573 RepID=UPI000B4588C1|nr:uncharacterized protein LOC110463616 isoform X5 [Mizuhopecten yessoensis]
MEILPENHLSNERALCSSMSKDNGGHDREDVEMQSVENCSSCANCRRRYRNHIFTSCCVCVVIVAMCCIIMGYNNHACALTMDSLNTRFLNIDKQISRLQKKYFIAKVSKVMADRSSFISRQEMEDNENVNGDKMQPQDKALETDNPGEVNIVKRSANKCQNVQKGKKRKRCLRKQEKQQKRRHTGQSLVRLVQKTVHKTVEQAVTKAMKKSLLSMHFEGDGNEHRPREDFAGRFHKWQYSDWAFKKKDLKEKFKLIHSTGDVIISEGGIYMLYAQVTLMGKPDQGFKVVVQRQNKQKDILSKCMMNFEPDTQETPIQSRQEDGYITCSSVGVFKLEKGDSVFLQHTKDTNVKADFRGNASFFGFVKLGDL